MIAPTTLVLGGARSGKSAHAEALCIDCGLARHYVATSQVWDDEMAARVETHKARRDGWTTHEEPLDLLGVLKRECRTDRVLLVDCLTLWLTNLLMDDTRDPSADCAALVDALPFAGPVVFVSNEVGLGIVPENKLARRFRDLTGTLHQNIASHAQRVHFVAAGLPLTLKDTSTHG